MKIVRFFGLDSESTIQQAKDYLGEEAVIFSHREINEGIEVLAAAPSESTSESPEAKISVNDKRNGRTELARIRLHAHLMTLGLGEDLAGKLAYKTDSINLSTPQTAIRDAHTKLAKILPTLQQPIIAAGKTIAVLGGDLAGKTTTLIKLAQQATEHDDIGALNYLTTEKLSDAETIKLIHKLAHPRASVTTEIKALDLARKRFDATEPTLTLVDSPALTQKDLRHPERLITASQRSGVDNYLLLPADLPGTVLDKIVSSLTAGMKIKGCIITMVDKTNSLGHVFATVIKHQLPIALWSDGESLDSHLYQAQPKHLIEKAITVQRQASITGNRLEEHPEQQRLM